MSKADKHTPLSSEELLKLLENHSGKATDFDGMDDFEKEALEGFSKFSTPEKAAAMVQEVNLAVSKKVSEEAGSTKKNNLIWFSAAASIVLLIILSVFFLNQSKEDMATNMALNDLTPPPPTLQPAITAPDAAASVTEPVNEKPDRSANTGKAEEKESLEQLQRNRRETEEAKPALEVSKEIAFTGTNVQEESETIAIASNNTATYKSNADAKDADLLKKNEFESADKFVAAKPAATTKNKEETSNGSAPSMGSMNTIATVAGIEQNANSKYDNRILAEKAGKKSRVKESAPAYAAESEMDQEVLTAYYKGGELDIKEYVVNYLQKNSLSLTGKYKVKANVLTNGALKVKSVSHISNELCGDCESILKKALGEMTGWTPAMWGKTASESSVDFVLSF